MITDYSKVFSMEVMCRGFIFAHKHDGTIECYPSKDEYEKFMSFDVDGSILMTELLFDEQRTTYPTGDSLTFNEKFSPDMPFITSRTIGQCIVPLYGRILEYYHNKDEKFDTIIARNKLTNGSYQKQTNIIPQHYMSSITSLNVNEYAFMDFMIDSFKLIDDYTENVPCSLLDIMIDIDSGYGMINDFVRVIHKSVTGEP